MSEDIRLTYKGRIAMTLMAYIERIAEAPAESVIPITDMTAEMIMGAHENWCREALEDMCLHFAIQVTTPLGPALRTGGLTTLKEAFSALGWEDTHLCPEYKCQTDGCLSWATTGKPTSGGYKRLCYDHYKQADMERRS